MSRELYGFPNRSPKQRFRRDQLPEQMWNDRAWQFRDEEQRELSDPFLLWNRDRALRNFDLSLAYFETLDAAEFEGAIDTVLAKAKSLKPVDDLTAWNEADGVYVMVFDAYKQFYVGMASDIRARIRQHWTGRKPFDRLVFGSTYNSILPVDELGQLDTTRIFAARSRNRYSLEEKLEAVADQRFTLNRMAGGTAGPLELMLTGQIRSRDHGFIALPATWDEYDEARDRVPALVDEVRRTQADPTTVLAELDMSIRSSVRDDGSTYLWSNRDLVANAFAFDQLITSKEFERFLTLMGEKVVWPLKG
jgi:hypothetical protein